MLGVCTIFAVILTWKFSVVCCDQIEVETPLGTVRGFETWSFGNTLFYSFLGIPYAKPPIGKKRFKPPEPMEPWNGVFEADKHVPCLQYDPVTHFIKGGEDCLMASVYTPKLPDKSKDNLLPVFVWIHGSNFVRGSGNADVNGPNRLMDYDIVMVTMNFRLGPLGFMSLGDEELPGNLGLWDQKLALEWVQLNIASFGGDPRKVTIAGAGAGGICATLHYISPQSTGLFRSVLAISGTALSYSIQSKSDHSRYTRALAEKLGCDSKMESSKIVDCLSTKTAEAITRKAFIFASDKDDYPMPFHPVLDDFASNPFIPMEPMKALDNHRFNDVPLIIGYNKDEGAKLMTSMLKNETLLGLTIENWNDFASAVLFNRVSGDVTEAEKSVLELINLQYFGKVSHPEKSQFVDTFGRIFTDTLHSSSAHAFALKAALKSTSPVYLYIFAHTGSLCMAEIVHLTFWQVLAKFFGRCIGFDFFPSSKKYAAHGDDQALVFNANYIPFDGAFSEQDKAVSRHLLRMWTNFAENGQNPTSTYENFSWTPLSNFSQKRLEIGSEGLYMVDLDHPLMQFWYEKIWKFLPPQMSLGPFYNFTLNAQTHAKNADKDEL